MRPETTSALRRANMRTLASLEFRVGLYWWLTRVLPAQPQGGAWVAATLICTAAFAGVLGLDVAVYVHPAPAADWVAVVFWYPARVLILLALAALWVDADVRTPGKRKSPAAGGAADPGTGAHLSRLLPLSSYRREASAAVGRLAAMALPFLLGTGLLACGWLVARSGGVWRPELREAAVWAVGAPLLLALSRTGRLFGSGRGWCQNPILPYMLYRIAVTTQLRPWAVAAWFGVPALAFVTIHLAAPHVRTGLTYLRGRSPDLSDGRARRPLVRWGLNWYRACTPEAGPRAWLRALAVLAVQGVMLCGASVVLSALVSADLAVGLALACSIALPAYGVVLAIQTSTGVGFGSAPQALGELLPLPPASLWRGQLLAGLTGAVVFAALGEVLVIGGLALIRVITGVPATAPPVVYWVPPVMVAAGLVAWAQGPLLRYPLRLLELSQTFWVVVLSVSVFVLILIAAKVTATGASVLVCLALLWPVGVGMVLLSRQAADPRTWHLDLDGSPAYSAEQRAQGAILVALGSAALAAGCVLAAIFGAFVS